MIFEISLINAQWEWLQVKRECGINSFLDIERHWPYIVQFFVLFHAIYFAMRNSGPQVPIGTYYVFLEKRSNHTVFKDTRFSTNSKLPKLKLLTNIACLCTFCYVFKLIFLKLKLNTFFGFVLLGCKSPKNRFGRVFVWSDMKNARVNQV